MSALDPLEQRVADDWPPSRWSDLTILVGVSGGADSVSLAHALARLREAGPGRLIVAHFHHGLRGAAADADAAFVARLAQQLQVEFEIGYAVRSQASGHSVASTASPPPSTSEANAREQRYRFLREVAHRHGARYVALAHTADDQAETVLHRLLRGTGLRGLRGIPRTRLLSEAVTVIRPLLSLTRREVLAYLQRRDIPYCVDATNADLRYTRNRLRRQLLPHLARRYNPRVVEALTRLADQATQVEAWLSPQVQLLAQKAVLPQGDWRGMSLTDRQAVVLDCHALREVPELLVRELLATIWRNHGWPEQAMTNAHWRRLARWAIGSTGVASSAIDMPGGIHGRRSETGQAILGKSLARHD